MQSKDELRDCASHAADFPVGTKEKRAYQTPRLVVYGDFFQLTTQTGTKGGTKNDGSAFTRV